MKGIIFNLLEEVVSRELGADAWDTLLRAANLDGAYTSLGSYDDGQMLALVAAASKQLDQSPDAILRWFGRHAVPLLADRYPQFFAGHTSTRTFVLALNKIIHPEVRKLYPAALPPEFGFEAAADGTMIVEYHSERQLCALAVGLIEGAAEHFGEEVELRETACMRADAPRCVFHVQFGDRAQA